MSNMSYCRFKNTLRDLIDCQEALDDEEYKGCNITEQGSVYKLISLCKEISSTYSNFNFDFNEDDDNDLLDEDEDEEDVDEDDVYDRDAETAEERADYNR